MIRARLPGIAGATAVIALASTLLSTTPSGQAPGGAASLVDPPESLDGLRSQLAMSTMTARDQPLAPCVPALRRAVEETRDTAAGIWAGQFEVMAPGQGEWVLVVKGSGDAQPWRQRIGARGEKWLTPTMTGTTVEIVLEGPAQGNQPCPRVTLRAELHAGKPATPRGAVGPDDRWNLAAPQLTALQDRASIIQWEPSVVHLQIFDTKRGLPCSGFVITPHIVMTARHCVMSVEESANTSMRIGTAITRAIRLIMSQRDLDFSLLWVDAPAMPPPLLLAARTAPALVLWQSPGAHERVVSVLGCHPAAGSQGRFWHQCDTSVGTSGAPIQDRTSGAVVALHTNGCTNDGDPTCVNFGIPIGDIRARILNRLPALAALHASGAAELRAILQ